PIAGAAPVATGERGVAAVAGAPFGALEPDGAVGAAALPGAGGVLSTRSTSPFGTTMVILPTCRTRSMPRSSIVSQAMVPPFFRRTISACAAPTPARITTSAGRTRRAIASPSRRRAASFMDLDRGAETIDRDDRGGDAGGGEIGRNSRLRRFVTGVENTPQDAVAAAAADADRQDEQAL